MSPIMPQDGDSGAAMAGAGGYDVLVVDRMLPRRDGLSIIEDCASSGDHTPALILSALGQVDDRVNGLGPAATTICPSPTPSPNCWRASRRCARRSTPGEVETIYRGRRPRTRPAPPHRHTRRQADRLQPREFRLLEYLMRHAGQVVTRTMLLENVWDYHFDPQTNVIDVHISRLRAQDRQGLRRAAAAYRPRRRLHDPWRRSVGSSAPPPSSSPRSISRLFHLRRRFHPLHLLFDTTYSCPEQLRETIDEE